MTALFKSFLKKAAALLVAAAAAVLPGCSAFGHGGRDPSDSTDPVLPDPEYTAYLVGIGFPEDYAEKLSVLHVMHPVWTFEPLDVTGLSEGRYTWDYAVAQEYSDRRRNLVPSAGRYTRMRDFTDLSLYDTGWYAASEFAIEYMMDPRNFLDEVQIFQFCSLAFSESVTLDAVKDVLKGTFMEDSFLDGKRSDTTFAEYIFEVGRELGASPVYLAARIRNEQGTRGSGPMISGGCGDYLLRLFRETYGDPAESTDLPEGISSSGEELREFNGLYNYFNIGASGDGLFAVCLSGMKRALRGTPEMAEVWGSPEWNTGWKSIYGGAKAAVDNYLSRRQDTPYLQKFNVDPRSSGNFWAQYMQNLYGAYSEAVSISAAYAESGLTDLPWNFSVPVYSGMPDSCPEPDGSEFTGRKILRELGGTSVAADIASADGAVSAVFDGLPGSVPLVMPEGDSWIVSMGEFDLSQFSDVIVEYSCGSYLSSAGPGSRKTTVRPDEDGVSGDSLFTGTLSVCGRTPGTAGDSGTAKLSTEAGRAGLTVSAGDSVLLKKTVVIDISGSDYSGMVYLCGAIPGGGGLIVVRNIVFIARDGFAGGAN
ncbi:MAG: hypothetical protein J6V48_07195 [Clostridia bacterium]|nr:hypothetical protein [Clostridia bacterium]